MRPKIVLAIFLPAILVIGVMLFLRSHPSAPAPAPAPVPAPSVAPTPVSTATPTPAPAPVKVKKTLSPEERQAAINAETDRLSAWAMNNDMQSLSNILNDLASPEKEIRLAAIEAAKQFESTNAIPALKAASVNAEDNQEAIAMLEAADWLALPTVDFHRPDTKPQLTPAQMQSIEQSRAKAQARRDARQQKRNPPTDQPQNSPSANDQNSTTSQGQ